MPAPDPLPVLARFIEPNQPLRIESLANAGGWSGSLLWRITLGAGPQTQLGAGLQTPPLCLRRWPREHPTAARLALIHYVLTHAAAQGIDFVPVPRQVVGTLRVPLPAHGTRSAPATFLKHAGYLWELTPWLPGQADFHANPSQPRLAAAMQALARFHIASEGIGRTAREHQPARFAPAPAIHERLDLLQQLLAGEFDQIAAAAGRRLSSDLDERAARILALPRDRLAPLVGPLQAAAQRQLPVQPAIRDIHHDHVLFTGERVTGLIDFGTLRIDTPLADIARLVGSLVGDEPAARRFALDAYYQLRPLSDRDRELIDLLDRSGVILSGLNWLRWLYVERRDMGPLPPIVKRLDEIIVRLLPPDL